MQSLGRVSVSSSVVPLFALRLRCFPLQHAISEECKHNLLWPPCLESNTSMEASYSLEQRQLLGI
jgi:hypothetical protein